MSYKLKTHLDNRKGHKMKEILSDKLTPVQIETIMQTQKTLMNSMLEEQQKLLTKTQLEVAEKYVLPRISWYKALLENNIEQELALSFIWQYLLLTSKRKQQVMKILGKLPFLGYAIFRRMMYKALQCDAWDNDFIRYNKKSFCFNTKRCVYKELADFYNCPEITPLFCNIDHVLFDNMQTIKFERSQTLGEGGNMCDFHFYNKI